MNSMLWGAFLFKFFLQISRIEKKEHKPWTQIGSCNKYTRRQSTIWIFSVRNIIHFSMKSSRNNIMNAKHIIIIILHLFIFAISIIRSFIHSFVRSHMLRVPEASFWWNVWLHVCEWVWVCALLNMWKLSVQLLLCRLLHMAYNFIRYVHFNYLVCLRLFQTLLWIQDHTN